MVHNISLERGFVFTKKDQNIFTKNRENMQKHIFFKYVDKYIISFTDTAVT